MSGRKVNESGSHGANPGRTVTVSFLNRNKPFHSRSVISRMKIIIEDKATPERGAKNARTLYPRSVRFAKLNINGAVA